MCGPLMKVTRNRSPNAPESRPEDKEHTGCTTQSRASPQRKEGEGETMMTAY
jgi:hypothetical protein